MASRAEDKDARTHETAPDSVSLTRLPEPRPAHPPAPHSRGGLVGSVVADRYLVHELLGRGGMGEVYLAEHVHMKKRVALKVLQGALTQSEDIVQRFEREAVAAGRIHHPGVVTATDFGPLPGGSFYLALELIAGHSLSEELEKCGRMPSERIFGILYQIAAALEAAHAAGIVHRDLKPENVMLATSGEHEDFVKVLDFGIAKMLTDVAAEGEPETGAGLTRAGAIFGTPEYMSPEQAQGEAVDQRSDLYSLGMIGYELAMGQTAFANSDVVAVLRGQILEAPPPLDASLDPDLARIVLRLLAKEPAARPQSATELLVAFFELGAAKGWALPEPKTGVGMRVPMRSLGGAGPASWGVSKDFLIKPLESLRSLSMRPVPIGPKKVPLYLPLFALSIGLGLGAWFVRGQASDGGGAEGTLVTTAATEVWPDVELARSGDRAALGVLRKFLDEKERVTPSGAPESEKVRLAKSFRALAQGFSRIHLNVPFLEASERALAWNAASAVDGMLLDELKAALADREASDSAFLFAQKHLGSGGSDLIWDLYQEERRRAGSSPLAARYLRMLRGDDGKSVLSPELAALLELEKAKVCAEYRMVLVNRATSLDERASSKLEALEAKRGCGPTAATDCFPCLRKGLDLAALREQAKARKRPALTFR